MSVLRLYTLAPLIETEHFTEAAYQGIIDQQFADWAGMQVTGRFLEIGPGSVENELDDALAVPGLLLAGLQAQQDGADGILVDCMLDPGLKALRTALDIPVMGSAEISFRMAASLGGRFGILDVCDDTGPMVEAQVRAMGLYDSFAGLRGTGLGVLEVEQDRSLTLERLQTAALQAINEDRAEILVFGCTEFSSYASALRQRLLEQGWDIPLINPLALCVGVLAAVVRSGAKHSPRTYHRPSGHKDLRGFMLPSLYKIVT